MVETKIMKLLSFYQDNNTKRLLCYYRMEEL